MQLIVPSCAIGKELCTTFGNSGICFSSQFDFASKKGVDQMPSSIRSILYNERSEFESIFTNINDRLKVSV